MRQNNTRFIILLILILLSMILTACNESELRENLTETELVDTSLDTELNDAEDAFLCIEHSFGAWNTVEEATCVKTGLERRQCEVCHEEDFRETPKTGHSGEWAIYRESTCATKGERTRICTICLACETEELQLIDNHEVNIKVVTEQPSCKPGTYIYVCACGKLSSSPYEIPPLYAHTEGNTLDVLHEATCEETGLKTVICTVCEMDYTAVIPIADHTGEWETIETPTCSNAGKKILRDCIYCHQFFEEEISATGHSFAEEWSYNDTYHWHAAICGHNREVSKKAEHRYGEDGNCLDCGKVYENTGLIFTLKSDSYYEVSGYTGNGICLIIPAYYNNLPVRNIAEFAITSRNLLSLTIPSTMRNINGISCSRLQEVINLSSIEIDFWVGLEIHDGVSKLVKQGDYIFYTLEQTNYLIGYIGTDTEITLPTSYNGDKYEIASSAFFMNSDLMSIQIPNGVVKIGADAFGRCIALETVLLGETITSIGAYAFDQCSALEQISIPKNVEKIGEGTFRDCSGLMSVTILSSKLTEISPYAFQNCKNLTLVLLSTGVQSIGKYAFEYCTELKEIDIPETVKVIEEQAFFGCSQLASVKFNEGLQTLKMSAFAGCTMLEEIFIPKSVTEIGNSAFNGCVALKIVVFANGLKTIGASAFYGCSQLESIELPISVEMIGDQAFYDCKNLMFVTINVGVKNIGLSAFWNPPIVASINFYGTKAQWQAINGTAEMTNRVSCTDGDILY